MKLPLNKFLFIIGGFFLLTATSVHAFEFSGMVVRVVDGDTLKIMYKLEPVGVRLKGINCPDLEQPFREEAKRFTTELVYQKVVSVRGRKSDGRGHFLAEVILSDGRNLNRELVKAGLARWNRRLEPDSGILERLQIEAMKENRGMWGDTKSEPAEELGKNKNTPGKSQETK